MTWIKMPGKAIELRWSLNRPPVRVVIKKGMPIVTEEGVTHRPTGQNQNQNQTRWEYGTGPCESILVKTEDGGVWLKVFWRF